MFFFLFLFILLKIKKKRKKTGSARGTPAQRGSYFPVALLPASFSRWPPVAIEYSGTMWGLSSRALSLGSPRRLRFVPRQYALSTENAAGKSHPKTPIHNAHTAWRATSPLLQKFTNAYGPTQNATLQRSAEFQKGGLDQYFFLRSIFFIELCSPGGRLRGPGASCAGRPNGTQGRHPTRRPG